MADDASSDASESDDGSWPDELCQRLGISEPPAWSKALPKHKKTRILDGVLNLGQQEGVEELFDEYADEFDHHLVQDLSYNVPAQLLERVPRPIDRCLDLGCGTGLAGEAFRTTCRWLEGVDLSAKMVEKARVRGCYDKLYSKDLVAHLKCQETASFDALISADVLIYLTPTNLARLFEEAHRVLGSNGLFLFTTESASEEEAPGGYIKRTSTDRYAHTRAFMLEKAKGFEADVAEEIVVRMEGGSEVPGDLLVLRKVN
eukprot:TRINITY_DN77955_c0_g1_i1.p1 TRINITY_DN77955_c0_g1~~TRINITY_DN77955_c0_g1_i1.p1  ORF type:complete len:259 (-),score=71.91 TRINITY_DN77955_c0_g1_i1:83-859(-)